MVFRLEIHSFKLGLSSLAYVMRAENIWLKYISLNRAWLDSFGLTNGKPFKNK